MLYKRIKELIVKEVVRDWCRLPYPGHLNGCPNFGKSEQCPPKVKMVYDIFDINKPMWFIYIKFNLEEHSKKMKLLHPNWSEKQCRCCLYWQNKVRKQLKEDCIKFMKALYKCNISYICTLIPEAMGVNVFETANMIGIPVRSEAWPIIYKIALIGSKNETNISN